MVRKAWIIRTAIMFWTQFRYLAFTQTRCVKGESHRGTWDNDRAASEWLEVHAEAVAKSQGSQKR